MVPQTSWGKNLRAVLTPDEWTKVKKHAYQAAGYRCIVCGGKGPEWPVEADEAWELDDQSKRQVLKGVIALCPPCHLVRHWGQATISGRAEIALAQMERVNGWTRTQAEAAGAEGMDTWSARSRHQWTIDYEWVTRAHGLTVTAAGLDQAEAANQELVAKAEERARGSERSWLNQILG